MSVSQQPQSVSWCVHGLQMAGLSWGEPGSEPVLALHGWLDNAASFSLLAPLLGGCQVVALDLTGHGRSAWRSDDAGYQIWDDLPEIVAIADALGWTSFNLLGHSRGAVIGTLLASAVPQRVRRLVLLDAVLPEPLAEGEFSRQLGRFLSDKRRFLQRRHRVFATVDAAVATRAQRGLGAPAAQLLVQRNLRECAGGFTWTTDPRLQGASAVKLTAGQAQTVLECVAAPTLLLHAREGHVSKHPEITAIAQRCIRQLSVEQVAGGHHFHMEDAVSAVARSVTAFLQEPAERGAL